MISHIRKNIVYFTSQKKQLKKYNNGMISITE